MSHNPQVMLNHQQPHEVHLILKTWGSFLRNTEKGVHEIDLFQQVLGLCPELSQLSCIHLLGHDFLYLFHDLLVKLGKRVIFLLTWKNAANEWTEQRESGTCNGIHHAHQGAQAATHHVEDFIRLRCLTFGPIGEKLRCDWAKPIHQVWVRCSRLEIIKSFISLAKRLPNLFELFFCSILKQIAHDHCIVVHFPPQTGPTPKNITFILTSFGRTSWTCSIPKCWSAGMVSNATFSHVAFLNYAQLAMGYPSERPDTRVRKTALFIWQLSCIASRGFCSQCCSCCWRRLMLVLLAAPAARSWIKSLRCTGFNSIPGGRKIPDQVSNPSNSQFS